MSITYPGGLITKNPVVPNDGVASGIWTLSEQAYWKKQGGWDLADDPNFKNVTLLLNGDGTNGAQNNTFLDSSTNNFTITRNGNTTQGSFSPYGNLWSNYFGGNGNYLSTTATSAFNFTGDWTMECWGNISDAGRSADSTKYGNFFGCGTTNSVSNSWNLYFLISGGVITELAFDWGSSFFRPTVSIPLNTWFHVACVRNGTTVTIYLNGTSVGTTTVSGTINGSSTFYVGQGHYGGSYVNWMQGYLSSVRINNTTALYTSNFTPSTTPLTAVSGTSMLTSQSNRFIDNSTNNATITVTGSPSVQRFSPFEPTAPYSTSVIGGSGYFDGSGDNLKVPAGSAFAYGTGDFTIEGWFYTTAALVQYGRNLFAQTVSGTTYLLCTLSDGTANNPPANKVQFSTQTMGALSGATTFAQNTWNHFAVVRNSGTVTVYLNGVGGTPVASTDNFTNTTYVPTIGNWTHDSTNQTFVGHLSNFRITKSAVYTSNFTPSTAPLTNIANTSLLANMSNAGIPDLAMQNNLETVGNAQVSTSVKKYGTGSLAFDGTGDWLTMPSSQSVAFGTGDFTVEFWYYTSTTSGWRGLITTQSSDGEANTFRLLLVNGNTGIRLKVATTDLDFTQTLTANAWNHVALVKSSGVYSLYYNGTKNGTTHSNSTSLNAKPMTIAANLVDGTEPFTGYIDDLRISKIARYTANFTPPAAALPRK